MEVNVFGYWSSGLWKMEAVDPSEILATIYKTTQPHNPEHQSKNIKNVLLYQEVHFKQSIPFVVKYLRIILNMRYILKLICAFKC
jgi:hypothetical protein